MRVYHLSRNCRIIMTDEENGTVERTVKYEDTRAKFNDAKSLAIALNFVGATEKEISQAKELFEI